MKKSSLLLLSSFIFLPRLFAQSVAINTDGSVATASSILDIKSTTKGLLIPRMTTVQRAAIAAPAKGLIVFDITTNGLWFHDGTTWNPLSAGSSTNYWSLNGSDIYNNTSGNAGIGTTTPGDKLTVQTVTNTFGISHTDGTITVGTWVGLGDGWLGTKSNHPLAFFTNNSAPQMLIATNGNVGIGLGFSIPLAKLHIAGNVKIDDNNTLEFGAGVVGKEVSAGKIGYQTYTPGALDIVGAGTVGANRKIKFWNEGGASFAGNIGILEALPINKLQIGSMGATGFNGNDLAIGNGTNALGIFQSNSSTAFVSSTDIVLMPRNNGHGRVGINTTNPRAPLDVSDFITVPIAPGATGFYGYLNFAGSTGTSETTTTVGLVSIYAAGRVYASEFDAFSDARIKNSVGISNSSRDLETINALQITNYNMRDKIKYGNKLYKKVIAQEVEKVYPQVVSKHTDFIPNVYQLTNKIEKTATGYLLNFSNKHNISNTAKKLRVLLSDTGAMQEIEIVSIPSDTQVIINAHDIKSAKVFVYGEEVNDFRTVDYEGLTTLNISATQELSKLIDAQNKKIAELAEEIKLLKEAKSTVLQTKQ